jgi:DNA-binding FadR family transcriptional regulator
MMASKKQKVNSSIADSIERSILQYVSSEKLAPGDPLPKEEELAASLNVSRQSVREGISGLKSLGVIESRKRRGMVLKEKVNPFEGVRKLADANLFSDDDKKDFIQMLVSMEIGMLSKIWDNRTPNDLQELREIASSSQGFDIEREIKFHTKLFSMSGNSVAIQFQNIITSTFEQDCIKGLEWHSNLPTYLTICDIMENGTLKEFESVMNKHLSIYMSNKNGDNLKMQKDPGYCSRELFTDLEEVESYTNIDFRLHHPERCEDFYAPEFPYASNLTCGGTLMQLDNGRWRLYFRGGYNWGTPFVEEGEQTPMISAAESSDGIHWERITTESILNKDSFGKDLVNYVLNATIYLDKNPDAPADERFKMIFQGYRSDDCWGLMLAVSPDGLNFRLKFENPMNIESQFDTHNVFFWDENIKKYRLYTRIRRFGKRGIRMHLTDDFVTFTNASDLVFRNDEYPDTQLYTNEIAPYFRSAKFMLGFPVRYCDHGQIWTKSQLYPPGAERRAYWANKCKYTRMGTVATDTLFMSSRNGWIWDRKDESFLRPGPCTEGSWIYGDNYFVYGMIPTKSGLGFGAPDELSFYVSENYVGDQGKPARLRRLKIRQDGFVSVHFGTKDGELVTRPFVLTESSISLNIATSAWGLLTVEILDECGNVIPGYGKNEMYKIYGDSIDIRPMWHKNGSDLSELKGRKIALRFIGRDADLYSYCHVPYRPDPELPEISPEATFEPKI